MAVQDAIRRKLVSDRVVSGLTGSFEEFPYNENANLKRPCMIIDNPDVLRKLVDEHLIPQGHEHSEDIIHDPKVVAWIDRYAQRFKELTDPVWDAQIRDPSDRWYKEGMEYKSLFEFRSRQ